MKTLNKTSARSRISTPAEMAAKTSAWTIAGTKVTTLAATSLAVSGIALLARMATDPDSRWYRRLGKPPWRPPTPVFALVWAPLYGLLAYAGARALDRGGKDVAAAYALDLGLNAAWTPLFFRGHRARAALAEILMLDVANLALLRRAWRADRTAGALLVPYVAWTAYATSLNADIVRRNS